MANDENEKRDNLHIKWIFLDVVGGDKRTTARRSFGIAYGWGIWYNEDDGDDSKNNDTEIQREQKKIVKQKRTPDRQTFGNLHDI